MEHLVGRIHAKNYLYFTKDELDAKGTGHNKPLYIIVRCKDCTIGNVLVDNNLALNVLLKHVLDEMPVDYTYMLPNTMTAKAYDCSPKQVVGAIKIELFIDPQMFLVILQVMDIHQSYNMLLGRPWIHVTGVMVSSLHQCMKYIVNGILVTVKAEDTMAMIQNMTVPYIETEGRKDENLYAFEIINIEWVQKNTVLRKMVISKVARMTVKYLLKT
jgi:hypothetical protein